MSRLEAAFERSRSRGSAALIPFVTAGIPTLAATPAILHTLVDGGADVIEVGIPFSDPMADGPVIQRASEHALANGVTLERVLGAVAEFRRGDERTPIVLMGYANSLFAMGEVAFARAAADAGVDAVLIVDLPPEEGTSLFDELRATGIRSIHLVAPTTEPERRRLICRSASGFVYYVAVKGTTGGSSATTDEVARAVAELRSVTELPIGVGFGIRDAASAAAMGQVADAVIVGSALVERIDSHAGSEAELLEMAGAFIAEFRQALDQGRAA